MATTSRSGAADVSRCHDRRRSGVPAPTRWFDPIRRCSSGALCIPPCAKHSANPNGLDGVFGQGTRTALTNFQASNGLPQTPNATTIDDVPSETIDAMRSGLDAADIDHIP